MNLSNSTTLILFSWVTILFAAVLPCEAQKGAAKQDLATVSIQVIDEFGHTVVCRVVSFLDTYTNRELVQRFNGCQGTDIPYGFYDYRLRRSDSPLGDDLSGRITVHSPEAVFVVSVAGSYISGVAIDRATPRGFVIRGRLDPMPPMAPSLEPIRVRLSPIHRSEHLDLEVDRSGEFRIYQPIVGRYVLSVIRGTEVLHVQLMSFEKGRLPLSFVIKLPENVPVVQYVR